MKLEEGRKFKTTDDEGYSLNNVDHLKPVFIGFKKPADIKGICKKSQQFRLFMYGENDKLEKISSKYKRSNTVLEIL